MKFAIVDDQLIETKLLSKFITKFADDRELKNVELCCFTSGQEMLDSFSEREYNIIFLDIYMDGMSGIELARHIRTIDSEVKIVFCTSSNEFAAESYEVNASFYLLKPYTYEGFCSMMKLVLPKCQQGTESVILSDGQKIIPGNIIFSEYYNHKITIRSRIGHEVAVRMGQSEFESALIDFNFLISCNRGILININEVKKIEPDTVIMSTGDILPVSRAKYAAVKEKYDEFMLNKIKSNI